MHVPYMPNVVEQKQMRPVVTSEESSLFVDRDTWFTGYIDFDNRGLLSRLRFLIGVEK